MDTAIYNEKPATELVEVPVFPIYIGEARKGFVD